MGALSARHHFRAFLSLDRQLLLGFGADVASDEFLVFETDIPERDSEDEFVSLRRTVADFAAHDVKFVFKRERHEQVLTHIESRIESDAQSAFADFLALSDFVNAVHQNADGPPKPAARKSSFREKFARHMVLIGIRARGT